MPTIGGGDDFVWIGGPDEGLWLLVVVGDEAIDGGLEIDDAFEDAALEAPLAAPWGLRWEQSLPSTTGHRDAAGHHILHECLRRPIFCPLGAQSSCMAFALL